MNMSDADRAAALWLALFVLAAELEIRGLFLMAAAARRVLAETRA